MSSSQRTWGLRLAGVLCALLVLVRGPKWAVSYDAPSHFRGDFSMQERALRSVERRVASLHAARFGQSDATFEGEWLIVAYLGSALTAGHVARAYPSLRPRAVALLRTIADGLLTPRVRAFDRGQWSGEDPLDGLGGPHSHLAWVGYSNVAFSVLRRFDPEGPHAARNDALTAHLVRHYEAAGDAGLVLTYPGNLFPADNAVAVASIALHGRATGTDHSRVLRRFGETLRQRYVEPRSGLLYQRLDPDTLRPVDTPRASGTAYSAWFLAYADPPLARTLYEATARMHRTALGFGAIREHPDGSWRADLDSGPVLFGVGVSPSGFALAASRMHGDEARFTSLYATAQLFGMPARVDGATTYVAGGALGDALLSAAVTARGDL